MNDPYNQKCFFAYRFAYTDKVESVDLTTNLLAAADKYDMPCLFQKCQLQLCSFITVANVAERYLTAYLHEAAILKKVATLFIIKHYKDVKKTAEFSSILKHPIALMNILDHLLNSDSV